MTQSEIDGLSGLDELLATLNQTDFNASIVEPDGTAHGWITVSRNLNSDCSESLWFGLRREGERFRFDAYKDATFDFFDGDQRMYSFGTLLEVKAFVRGILWAVSNS